MATRDPDFDPENPPATPFKMTTEFTVVTNASQLGACDAVVVVSWNVDLALRGRAAAEFPRATALQAYYPGVLLER